MSIAGIVSSNLFQNSITQQTQNRFQQIQSQFQKLGQDLQAGNLTQAQSDFSTLSQELPNGGQFGAASANAASSTTASGATPTSTANPVLQAFQSLGKDLQSGNLSAAQQDFATIQQSAQQSQASGQAQHGHHHHHGSGDSNSTSPTSTLQQDFTSLGQDLQSSNLSSAQQAYSSLQSDLAQFLPSFASGSTGSSATTASASLPDPSRKTQFTERRGQSCALSFLNTLRNRSTSPSSETNHRYSQFRMRIHRQRSLLSPARKKPNKVPLFHSLSARKIGIKLAPLTPRGASNGASL